MPMLCCVENDIWIVLFFYALRMLPYIKEIYGSDGIVPVVTANWTYGIFPNILAIYSGYEAALVLHMILIVAGLALAGGFYHESPLYLYGIYKQHSTIETYSQMIHLWHLLDCCYLCLLLFLLNQSLVSG